MTRGLWITLAALLFSTPFAVAGCGRHAAPTPKAKPAAKESVPLPDWAPKNPSPEFLRAAKVLKPLPPEVSRSQTSNVVSLTDAKKARMEQLLNPASYQVFGTLSDEQIKRFLLKKEIRLPIRAMTALQRRALDQWLDAYAEASKGGSQEYADMRVVLYRFGAKEDLANVDAGFIAASGHAVHIQFWVRRRDGKEATLNSYFADI